MRATSKLVSGLVVALVAGFGVASCTRGIAADVPDVKDRKECEVALALPNMVCAEGCPTKVRAALARVTGVRGVGVDFDTKNAVVDAEYPACSRDGVEHMLEELHAKGYEAHVVQVRAINRME